MTLTALARPLTGFGHLQVFCPRSLSAYARHSAMNNWGQSALARFFRTLRMGTIPQEVFDESTQALFA